jgi:hypothetical protein
MKELTNIEGIFHSGTGGIAVSSFTREVLKLAAR